MTAAQAPTRDLCDEDHLTGNDDRVLGTRARVENERQPRASGTKFGRPRMVDDAEYIATARRMSCGCRT